MAVALPGTRIDRIAPHLLAGSATLSYAWAISRTALMPTGLQFVAPALIILSVHLGWGLWRGGWTAERILRRSATTAFWLIGLVLIGLIWAPMPGQAVELGDVAIGVLTVVACVLTLAVVVGVILGALWILFRLVKGSLALLRGKTSDTDRHNDLGSLCAVALILVAASLEGVPGSYRFDGLGQAGYSTSVAAPPDAVWAAMQTATSPAVRVPTILRALPQPTEVRVDEGVALGANRVVVFSGREGRGALHLRVVERTATQVRFETVSDRSPIAGWIGIEAITYSVVPAGAGTELRVDVAFERKLAPAVVFGPMMRGAAALAARVLVRDTAARAAGAG